jgi:hypothetical protein
MNEMARPNEKRGTVTMLLTDYDNMLKDLEFEKRLRFVKQQELNRKESDLEDKGMENAQLQRQIFVLTYDRDKFAKERANWQEYMNAHPRARDGYQKWLNARRDAQDGKEVNNMACTKKGKKGGSKKK